MAKFLGTHPSSTELPLLHKLTMNKQEQETETSERNLNWLSNADYLSCSSKQGAVYGWKTATSNTTVLNSYFIIILS